MKKNNNKKYSYSERRSFWVGVGHSLGFDDEFAKKNTAFLMENMSKSDRASYQSGLMATVYTPNLFEKKFVKGSKMHKNHNGFAKTTKNKGVKNGK